MPTEHRMINLKWPLWSFILFLSIPAVLWTYNEINTAWWNAQYIKVGKAVDCRTRPTPIYLGKFCDIEADGAACGDETRNRLQVWYEEIDAACGSFEPERRFRFIVDDTPKEVEYAEQTG